MRLKLKKIRIIGFIVFAIIAILFAYKYLYFKNSFVKNGNHQNMYYHLKSSYQQVDPIYIDDLDPNFSWNKIEAENNWCSGSGTYSDPYIIEDVIIDGTESKNCIFIINSIEWFKIRNCTVFNCGNTLDSAGIRLQNVKNGFISDNIIHHNYFGGIRIGECENLTIYRNNVSHNGWSGIDIYLSNNNSIIDNNVTYNEGTGIQISFDCTQNLISGNAMKECGFSFYDINNYKYTLNLPNNIIDNYINEKPIYYYFNESNLKSFNFSNAGQIILFNCSNVEISSLNITEKATSILLYFCNDILISNNTFNSDYIDGLDNNYGIDILNGTNLVISDNLIIDNTQGIISRRVLNSSFTDNIFRNYIKDGISLLYSNLNNISNNIFEGNYALYGITFDESNYNIISNNSISESDQGIYIVYSKNNTVLNNYIEDNVCGINLQESDDCSIIFNGIYSHQLGIYVDDGNSNNLTMNNLTKCDYGIRLRNTDFNTVINNKILESESFGIYLELNCQDNIISSNLMENCGLGIQEQNIYSLSFSNEIDTTNLVNDKPLYFFVDESYLKPSNFTDAGQIILIKCNDSLISNVSISYSSIGISCFFCSNISISNSLISYNSKFYGLFLFNSHSNIIFGNIIERNYIGIYFVESNFNRIVDNSFLYNQYPFVQIDSTGNTFNNNQIIPSEVPIIVITIIIIISSIGATITILSIIIVKKRRKKKQVIPLYEIDKIIRNEEYELIRLKKKILNLGTVFDRLHISEIAEECKSDLEKITSVVKEMIENRELSAKFKLKTNYVIFKQQDIASEIDKLLEIYDKWEKLKYSEKKA